MYKLACSLLASGSYDGAHYHVIMVTQTVPCIGNCCLIVQNSCYLVYRGSTLVLPAWHVVVDTSSKVALHCHALYYIPGPRYRLHVDAEHPAYPYSATDLARCRDGDVSRVSLKYDATECSPGLLSMEWYPSLFLKFRQFFHAGSHVLRKHSAPSLHLHLFLWK